jgi:hypothetical protein
MQIVLIQLFAQFKRILVFQLSIDTLWALKLRRRVDSFVGQQLEIFGKFKSTPKVLLLTV